jgi:hypothetical protein
MRLTLEILKRLNDFEFVLEVMGDFTGTDASLGPAHDMGDAHIKDGHVNTYKELPQSRKARVRLAER